MSAEELAARFASGAATVATCWALVRQDGVVFGFTDHDCDLSFDGIVFSATSGLRPHAVERSTGGNVDTTQISGALISDAITEADILAGRYRGAEVTQWMVDWSNPEVRVVQMRGRVGEIRQGDGRFEAELLSLTDIYNHPVGRSFVKACDRALGDAKCGVDLSDPAFVTSGHVTDVIDRNSFRCSIENTFDQGWFAHGVISWSTGSNAGRDMRVERDVPADGERVLTLAFEAEQAVSPGDAFSLVAGCDKAADTCQTKFANLANFRGFPHIPGTDWITAYPRGGAVPKLTIGNTGG